MDIETFVNVSVIFEDGTHWIHITHPTDGEYSPNDWNMEGSTPSWFDLDMQPILDRAYACAKAKVLTVEEIEALQEEETETGEASLLLFNIDADEYFIFATLEFRVED